MHNIQSEFNVIDPYVVESKDLVGKECQTCRRILAYQFYNRDSSYSDGRRNQCIECESAPRLSINEHTARLDEMNFNSEAVKSQRWKDQLDYMHADSRQGKRLHSSEFIRRLFNIIPRDKLYLVDGNFIGDVSVYRISGVKRADFDGPRNDFKYCFYIPLGWMPEFSIYEFDHRVIPVREHKRGWRTPLLRFVKSGLATEAQANWEFGPAEGKGSAVYQREMKQHRQNLLFNKIQN